MTFIYGLIFVACLGSKCEEFGIDAFKTMKECGAMLAQKAMDVDAFDKRYQYSLICKSIPTFKQ